MKTPLLCSLVLVLSLAPLGCDKNESPDANAAAAVDTSKTESVFASAEAGVKAGYDKVATAIKGTDWSGATTAIHDLAGNAKLSDTQKAALRNLGDQVKAKAGAVTAQTKEKAAQLAEDAKQAGAKAVEKTKEATSKAAQEVKQAASELLPKK